MVNARRAPTPESDADEDVDEDEDDADKAKEAAASGAPGGPARLVHRADPRVSSGHGGQIPFATFFPFSSTSSSRRPERRGELLSATVGCFARSAPDSCARRFLPHGPS